MKTRLLSAGVCLKQEIFPRELKMQLQNWTGLDPHPSAATHQLFGRLKQVL